MKICKTCRVGSRAGSRADESASSEKQWVVTVAERARLDFGLNAEPEQHFGVNLWESGDAVFFNLAQRPALVVNDFGNISKVTMSVLGTNAVYVKRDLLITDDKHAKIDPIPATTWKELILALEFIARQVNKPDHDEVEAENWATAVIWDAGEVLKIPAGVFGDPRINNSTLTTGLAFTTQLYYGDKSFSFTLENVSGRMVRIVPHRGTAFRVTSRSELRTVLVEMATEAMRGV